MGLRKKAINQGQQEVKKVKPKQIMVLHRDEETNEIIKTLVDKKKRKRVTKLRRVINIEREQNRSMRKQLREQMGRKKDSEDPEDELYETVNEESDNEDPEAAIEALG
mmetsp:Transcript_17626/g.29771  ORF Transcript_17626/g.29771 Transcript_17626/m.29771 type:complete len:108 (+) Transcript_17626:361-684(+)